MNDYRFICLCKGYERWCKGKTPGVRRSLLILSAVLLPLMLFFCWLASDLTMAVCTVISFIIVHFAFYSPEWPPLLNDYLNNYQPVDIDAFTAFQASVKADGELRKETLGKWIDVERHARLQRPRRSSGSTFTGRDITSTGNKAGR